MRLSRQAAWLLFFLGVGLILGFVFRAFIVANVVIPIAMILSLLWRMLLSVHQAIYWGAVIALAVGLAFHRLYQIGWREVEQDTPTTDSILSTIGSWRHLLQVSYETGTASKNLKHDLRRMLVAVYAAKQPEATPFVIEDALRLRRISLPDTIYDFLFDEVTQKKNPSLKQRLSQFAAIPQQLRRHWTGRDKVEFYKALEEILAHMEALMEVEHGNDYFNPSSDH